ncbi:mechanosensitive ion channel family protein [Catalinimonas sp. 4WD22]|uniref:mechanosensitive ion channel family protein n=1 Tax=Catalinimonas locisalis TaxID=3133978 RepID=UPI003101A056
MITYPSLQKKFLSICLTILFYSLNAVNAQDNNAQLFQSDTFSVKATNQSDIAFLLGLSQLIIKDKSRLRKLKLDSAQLEPVFQRTAIQFNQTDIRLDSLMNLPDPGIALATVEQEWKKLEDGLAYMLKRRRSIHQQMKVLQRKINKEQEAFSLAMKGTPAMVMEITEKKLLQDDNQSTLLDSANTSDTTLYEEEITFDKVNTEYNWRIVEAERELEILKAKFEVAKKTWFLVEQLLSINQDDYSIAMSLTQSSQDQLTQWKATIEALENNLSTLQASDSAEQLQAAIQDRINQAQAFMTSVESDIAEDTVLLATLQTRIDNLNVLKDPLAEAVADATLNITRQNRWLEYLRSPLSPHRLYSFVINTGPRIGLTLLLLFLLWAGARWLTVRILKGLSLSRFKSKEDSKERVETLSRAIRSGLTVLVLFIGFLAVLSELGIDVSVLLGGAAVFSLAIAFGAQTLVKDFFSGFMILSENQYRVGNVIKINQISGVVEDISLRTTVLRDLEGIAHFIPHGEITTVSNLTHRWSRVALDVGVAYKENVDHVMEVIMEVAHQMKQETEFSKLITGEPEMLGVDALSDSAVIIKVLVQTKPLKQWLVKREFLRRLKNRFDELGIEIPFPHRTIYHRDLTLPDFNGKSEKPSKSKAKADQQEK